MSVPAIRTDSLSCSFKTVKAVDELGLEVPAGIAFGFLGPNGAGKTTTIRLLLGLLEPTGGTALVLGRDCRTSADEIRLRSGALLEHTGLYERLSAEDNLDFYGRIWRMPLQERRDRIRELLTGFDLWDRRKERVRQWSRGMKQKLAVARAILHRPELIFLDEPTAGLDPVAAASLRDDLAGLVEREGLTVFLTTHNLAEAEKLCSMVGVINKGRLLTVGHPDELRSRAGKARVEISGSGFTEAVRAEIERMPEVVSAETNGTMCTVTFGKPVATAPLVRLLVGKGVEIEEVRKGTASLEEAFLKLLEETE